MGAAPHVIRHARMTTISIGGIGVPGILQSVNGMGGYAAYPAARQ